MSALQTQGWYLRALLPLTCALLLNACDESGRGEGARAGEIRETAPSNAAEGPTGTLAFELKAAGEITLNKFDYAITGPNLARAGTIDVSNSNTVSARIDALPVARGYSVTVVGKSVGEPVAQCSGSAAFDIAARTVTNVPIDISCHVERDTPPPTSVAAAPIPRAATWLCGLALLGLGLSLTKRKTSRSAA